MLKGKKTTRTPQGPKSVKSELRYQKRAAVVEAVQRGEAPRDVARVFNVPLNTVYDWLARYRQGGWDALRDRQRSGRPRKVDGTVMKWLYEAITMGNPQQFKFEFCLWTLKIVKDLLKKTFSIELSKSSLSRLLGQLGLSPQRPIFKAASQDPQAVEKYLKERYPEIRARARKMGAEIFFLDEAAFRSDHHSGTTWGPIGETPELKEHRGRFGYNAISAVSARGKMYFQTFTGKMDTSGFIAFLKKLRSDVGKPVIVITDRASYHKAKKATEYITSTQGEVGLELLPARSPELNPDEQVWNRAKERLGRMIIQNKDHMKNALQRVLRSLQRNAKLIKSFFQLNDTRYALI
jgi:transposase